MSQLSEFVERAEHLLGPEYRQQGEHEVCAWWWQRQVAAAISTAEDFIATECATRTSIAANISEAFSSASGDVPADLAEYIATREAELGGSFSKSELYALVKSLAAIRSIETSGILGGAA